MAIKLSWQAWLLLTMQARLDLLYGECAGYWTLDVI